MIETTIKKVMWLGRATVFCVGLSVILAVMLGVASAALAAVPGDPFQLGRLNAVNAVSRLAGNVSGAMLVIDNDGAGTALELRVGLSTTPPADKTVPPMRVDSQAKVTNLNADQLDGMDSTAFLATNGKAADADALDGVDSAGFLRSDAKATDATHADRADDADHLDGVDSTGFVPNRTYGIGTVSFSSSTLNGRNSAGIKCDEGDMVLHAGYGLVDTGTTILESEDFLGGRGWQVAWLNDGSPDQIRVTAHCLDLGEPHQEPTG